tara:strand:+ start:1140 stop:2042 length:903 start_codon:yes stop_codon:yes gene_type:complete
MKFGVARILGNDLDGMHGTNQTYENLKFTLQHEKLGNDTQVIYFLNRIVNLKKKKELIDLLHRYRQKFIDIPFNYRKFNSMYSQLRNRKLLKEVENLKLNEWNYREASKKLKKYNLLLINNNGSRNYAFDYMKRLKRFQWIFILDSNSYFMEEDFKKIKMNLSNINLDLDVGYFPLVRVKDNKEVLEKKLDDEPRFEGQLAFRNYMDIEFNDEIPYGGAPKAELLRVLGIPGPWEDWLDNVRTYGIQDRKKIECKWKIISKMIRLSANSRDYGIKNNQINRVQGLINLINFILKRKNIVK